MKETNLDQQLTELTGGCWHDFFDFECIKCGIKLNSFADCYKTYNPTYDNPKDLFNLMKGLGEEKYYKFMQSISIIVGAALVNSTDHKYYIDEEYITNTQVLKQKAVEFLKEER